MKHRFLFAIAAVLAAGLIAGTAGAKTLRIAYDADPVSLDPHEQLSAGTLQLSHMIFDPLVRWNREHGIDAR
ncbi:MAG: ABC transporter substrate-binding protein, partial [Rhodospirillales bacterium]|nr:ABC transporter substrate-binding protein [Rhodospirillales bacterium]